MKNFSLAFIIFLVWTTFGLWLYSWITPQQTIASNSIDKNETISLGPPPVVKQEIIEELVDELVIEDSIKISEKETKIVTGLIARTVNSDIIFSFDEGFSFKKDSIGVIIPATTIDYKYKLATYLKEHPELELHILSIYSPLEKLENPNLGIQRGHIIAKEIKKIVVNDNQVIIKSIIDDIDFNTNDIFENGMSFQFKPLDVNRPITNISEIPENITFYPRFSDSGILASKKLDDLVVSVKDIMEANPKLRLKVIGHTDNVSNANYNYSIGLKFAEELRWYFKEKGEINPDRIMAISRGEVRPIRSNKTASGRKANKRIELQFIE